jgi:hypothetical protein
MVDHFITLVENSGSYDRSNMLSSFLSDIENLTEKQIARLEGAFETNSQVAGSRGFLGQKDFNGRIFSKGLKLELERINGNKK